MRYRDLTVLMLAVFALLRVIYILLSPFDLSPDEAHYWEWSRRLSLSYYSKGPGVAWVIAFFTGIFGDTEFGVRVGAVFFSTAASFLMYLLGKDIFESEKVGFYSALLPNITPIFSIGSILMTTDVMFIFFWAAAILCVKKGTDKRRSGWWYLAGALIGLGFLSKYTMVLIYPCLLLYFLASRHDRFWLGRKEPYLAGLVSLAFATPVILWNILNGQVTIKHTMGQAHIGSGGMSFAPFFEFLASQAGLLTPFIFIAIVYGVWKSLCLGLRDRRKELLLVFFTSAPLFLFFLLKSFHGKVQANWAVASFVTAFPAAVWAFGMAYERRRARGKNFLKAVAVISVSIGVLASFIAYFPWVLEPLGVKKALTGPPYNRVTGWKELGAKVSVIKEEMEKDGPVFLASDTYQITSELAMYSLGNPVAYNMNTGARRMNQYDLWPGLEGVIGQNAVYVKGGDTEAEPEVLSGFERCEKELIVIHWGLRPLKEFTAFRCYGFKGISVKDKNESY